MWSLSIQIGAPLRNPDLPKIPEMELTICTFDDVQLPSIIGHFSGDVQPRDHRLLGGRYAAGSQNRYQAY